MPNMMQQYSDTEKLHTKIEAQKNLIDKQEHNLELLPSSHEGGSLWPAGWYPENWFSSSSSQPMSPPRTGGTGRRTRKASGPSSPDLNRFSSSPNMFCTVNC